MEVGGTKVVCLVGTGPGEVVFIATTPKAGWSGVDILGAVRRALGVPVGFDTDVNGAALGEGHWGAARDLDNFVYLTVGTGIGADAVIEGRLIHGLGHPEIGHLTVPRQAGDGFAGDVSVSRGLPGRYG